MFCSECYNDKDKMHATYPCNPLLCFSLNIPLRMDVRDHDEIRAHIDARQMERGTVSLNARGRERGGTRFP
jgi:hypothetical protein